MPTITFKTRIRTISDNSSLDLAVRHLLIAGEPSEVPRSVKGLPQGIDIISVSPLTITISGMLNGTRIPPEQLKSSRIAQHLPEYFRMNSSELGLEAISDSRVIEDTGQLAFFCTTSRPIRHLDNQLPHLKLLGFDMDYIWHETTSSESQPTPRAVDIVLIPFSPQLPLPYLIAVNNVVERFATFQMVKRYPRIFGAWSKQLDTEQEFISSLFNSLQNILRRSSNLKFREIYNKQLKVLMGTMSASLVEAEKTLDCLGASSRQETMRVDDETAVVLAVERIYFLSQKRRTFKSNSFYRTALQVPDDELDQHIHQTTIPDFEEELHSSASEAEQHCYNSSWRSGTNQEQSNEIVDHPDSPTLASFPAGPSVAKCPAARPQNDPILQSIFPGVICHDDETISSPSANFFIPGSWLDHQDPEYMQTSSPEDIDIFSEMPTGNLTSTSVITCSSSSTGSSSWDYDLDSEDDFPTVTKHCHAQSAKCSAQVNPSTRGLDLSQDTSGVNFYAEDDVFDLPSRTSGDILAATDCFRDMPFLFQPDENDQCTDAIPVDTPGVDFIAMEF